MTTHTLNTRAMARLMSTLTRTGAPASVIAELWAIRGMDPADQAPALARLQRDLQAIHEDAVAAGR